MNAIVYIIAEGANFFVKSLLCFQYMNFLYDRKRKGLSVPVAWAMIFAILDAANLLAVKTVFSNSLLFAVIGVNTILVVIMYYGKGLEKACNAIFYYVFLQLLDLLVTTLLFQSIGKRIVSQSLERTIYLIGCIVAQLVIYHVLHRIISNTRIVIQAFWAIFFDIVGLIAIIYFQKIYLARISPQMIVIWGMFLTYIVLMLVILVVSNFWHQSRQKLRIIEMKNVMMEENYNNLIRVYKENARVFHDFKAHIHAIYEYLQEEKTAECMQYIEDLTGPWTHMAAGVWTGNKLIDVIINYKRIEAETQGIDVEVDADMLETVKFKDIDLCVIFSNLLDNAIENNRNKGRIKIAIKRKNNLLVICIRNTTSHSCEIKEGKLQTQKKHKELHGFGLENVNLAVAKYDGTFTYTYKDNIFEVLVMLPLG